MPSSPIHQTLDFVASISADTAENGRDATWPFALMVLGLVAVLIGAAAAYPDIFAPVLNPFGAAGP